MTARNPASARRRRGTAAAPLVLVTAALTAAGFAVAIAQTNPPPAASAPPTTAPAVTPPAPPTAPAPPPAPSGFILPPPPPGAAQGANDKRGFFGEIGQWWDDSIANFKAKMKEQQSKIDDFNKKSADAAKDAAAATSQAMKDAADAMVRWPTSRVIEVHEVCARAGNGAPDCESAATNVCKGKGFKAGQPLDSRTAERCTDSLWMSGQPPSNDCPVETVLLRAACE